MLKIGIKLPIKYCLNLIYCCQSGLKITNEKHNCWINNLFIRLRKYVLFHIYNVLHAGTTIKPKLFDLLLIEAYSKGERRPTL
jgi:hypothetical protein